MKIFNFFRKFESNLKNGLSGSSVNISKIKIDGPEEHEELIVEFVDIAEAIVDITSAQDVINNVFD